MKKRRKTGTRRLLNRIQMIFKTPVICNLRFKFGNVVRSVSSFYEENNFKLFLTKQLWRCLSFGVNGA